MSCQVVEHEQQLQEALTAKHTAETQLQELNIKFDDVGREVTCLQKEVKKLKSGQNLIANSEDVQALENERTTLHTLSARLEEAMIQAKDVITFKDGVIESLEARLQLASKRGADAATLLKEERDRFEREKSDLLIQLQENKNSQNSTKDEEVLNLRKENMATQQQKAELTVKVAQLTLELETVRSQWTHDVRDKDRVEQGCARQVAEAEQQLEQATAAMQQQMAQFRNELDMKVARQRVATQVACKAGELKCDQLERELQRMRLKLGKQKAKMDKKARILVANSHEQHKESVVILQRELADLSERMNIVLEKEQKAMKRAQKSEEAVEQLRAELKGSAMELERERTAVWNVNKELETEKNAMKAEFELRAREMEQSVAKQIAEAESRVHEERDGQVQMLLEQHDAVVNRLKAVVREQEKTNTTMPRVIRQESSSTVSSSGEDESVSSNYSHQQSINELDALIDAKERRYRQPEKWRKPKDTSRPSSSPPTKDTSSSLKRTLAHKEEEITELSTRQKQLLAALATANEQETLAKKQIHETEVQRQQELVRYEALLQQLNSVKHENWNLSLALHVTETTHQQRRSLQTNPIY
ncbi:hypothetical protein PHMEG_00024953 [Phytophthora megakarya]|uniref:Uncharacterized protein n=1 Tax=Phytophthora megakarya TaxID=4795 RepID=A0A225VD85_9STRA|nr:hypothetical protein PHMEG_00024953 [Phytophthora megakarya]